MIITIKQLQGGECNLQVYPSTKILGIKQHIARKWKIPVDEQTILFLGRALADNQTVDAYPSIKEGARLNLVVKKPESLFEVTMKYFKKSGMSEVDARNATNEMLETLEDKINKLSWDELERLSIDCLMDEYGVQMPDSDQDSENESEGTFGL